MIAYLKNTLHVIGKENAGATAISWALALPLVIGGVGISTDVGSWYFAKRNLQNAVDAAAISAAYDITGNNPQQSTMYYTASREMSRNGFGSGTQMTLTVHYPPQSGTYSGDTQAVEALAAQPQPRFFSKLFLGSNPNAQVRAVASRQPQGSACVLSLSSSASSALLFQGNTTVNLNNCSAASNSTSSSAITLSGSSVLSTYSLYSAGNYSQSGSSSLTSQHPPVTNANPLPDPYSGLGIPSYSGCNQNNYSANNTVTINPGVYCGGMSFNSHANVTLNPGVYIINRGTFDAKAGSRITGTGVTIILTSSTGSNYATVDVSGGANVTLSASTGSTDPYAGVLFYQDRNAPVATNTNKFNGGSTTTYTGSLYFPNQEVQFTGNNSNGGGSCTKIIANTVTLTGDSYFTNTCPASVATLQTQGIVMLVE